MSDKRRKESAARRAFVRKFLSEHPRCEVGHVFVADRSTWPAARECRKWSVDVHEPLTRARGGSILDPDNVLATCRPCHDWIHANPTAATTLGLLRPSGLS
jgi:hypothetical protein